MNRAKAIRAIGEAIFVLIFAAVMGGLLISPARAGHDHLSITLGSPLVGTGTLVGGGAGTQLVSTTGMADIPVVLSDIAPHPILIGAKYEGPNAAEPSPTDVGPDYGKLDTWCVIPANEYECVLHVALSRSAPRGEPVRIFIDDEATVVDTTEGSVLRGPCTSEPNDTELAVIYTRGGATPEPSTPPIAPNPHPATCDTFVATSSPSTTTTPEPTLTTTPSGTVTATPTPSGSVTPTATTTITATPSPSPYPSASATPSGSASPDPTPSPSVARPPVVVAQAPYESQFRSRSCETSLILTQPAACQTGAAGDRAAGVMRASLSLAAHDSDFLPWGDARAEAGLAQSVPGSDYESGYVFRFRLDDVGIASSRAPMSFAAPVGDITVTARVQSPCSTAMQSTPVLSSPGDVQGRIVEVSVTSGPCPSGLVTLSAAVLSTGHLDVFSNGAIDVAARVSLLDIRRL
ncbi:MAG: hypothetical protein NVSMB57_07460 [Actinomycetota bacterium]